MMMMKHTISLQRRTEVELEGTRHIATAHRANALLRRACEAQAHVPVRVTESPPREPGPPVRNREMGTEPMGTILTFAS